MKSKWKIRIVVYLVVLACSSMQVPMAMAAQMETANFQNLAVSQVTGYVNIRESATTQSQVLGKIYNNSAATILETVSGEGGTWYKIQSGSVEGFIKACYFITGEAAEQMAREIGKEFVTINASELRLRAEPDTSSEVLTVLAEGAQYVVTDEIGDFYKIAIDVDMEGYVAREYCIEMVMFEQAVSITEELQSKEEEALRQQEATNAIAALEQIIKTENQSQIQDLASLIIPSSPIQGGLTEKIAAPQLQISVESESSGIVSSVTGPGTQEVISATRTAIVAYAKQFLGNPYVYGGTSLTNGADCSGFTQEIFKNFGITTGRSSRDQAANGTQISVDSVQVGDLLFYASGDYINHVAIYIGDGQVIHASNPTTGICISPYNYRSPYMAATFLD